MNKAVFIAMIMGIAQHFFPINQIAIAQEDVNALPWLSAMGDPLTLKDIDTIYTRSGVSVSDGLEYSATTFYRDADTYAFHRDYADRRVTLGVDGQYVWQFDGQTESAANYSISEFIIGHQLHAMLLKLNSLYDGEVSNEPVEFDSCSCMRFAIQNGDHAQAVIYDRATLIPQAIEISPPSFEASIIMRLSDWREVEGISLPFNIVIDDGSARAFTYQYNSVEFNTRSIREFRTPIEYLADEQKLMRYHILLMDAHIEENLDLAADNWGPEWTDISNGNVTRMDAGTARAGLAASLARRDHSRYVDMIRPIVKVSDDGTLGWVTAQVLAVGEVLDETGARLSPPRSFTFQSAWVEHYKKIDGQWHLTGIASSFKPN